MSWLRLLKHSQSPWLTPASWFKIHYATCLHYLHPLFIPLEFTCRLPTSWEQKIFNRISDNWRKAKDFRDLAKAAPCLLYRRIDKGCTSTTTPSPLLIHLSVSHSLRLFLSYMSWENIFKSLCPPWLKLPPWLIVLVPSLPLSEYSSLLSQWISGPLVRLSSFYYYYSIHPPPTFAHLSVITPPLPPLTTLVSNKLIPFNITSHLHLTLLSLGMQHMHSCSMEHTWRAFSTSNIANWKQQRCLAYARNSLLLCKKWHSNWPMPWRPLR